MKRNASYKYKFVHVQAQSHHMMNALVVPECPVNGSGGNIAKLTGTSYVCVPGEIIPKVRGPSRQG